MSVSPQNTASAICLPDIPALCVNATQAALLTTDGEIQLVSHAKAQQLIHDTPILVCHAPHTCQKLGAPDIKAFDILELFAFVHPARFCVPTPFGLAKALGLPLPEGLEDYPMSLMESAQALLSDLQKDPWQAKAGPLKIADVMGQQGKGWPWTPYIFEALGEKYNPAIPPESRSALNIWKNLPEWSEEAPPPPPSHNPVTGEESREQLQKLLGPGAEARQQQVNYATMMTAAFKPADNAEEPHAVLAEAGTGVGKTLGYLAPASIWAEKNKGSVWISTYTKNLQRQIDKELERVYTTPDLKDAKVSIRKGRENYLCLLNLEETSASAALSKHPGHAIAAGIMARWAAATKDGDLSGGDFPGWLAGLLGFQHTMGLADRRGECIYSACDHYHRCFVEQSVRKSNHANIVVANHALVMIQTALSSPGDNMPQRYIFDEGHHLFDAADSAFAGHLTARETYDLRRWIRGSEGGRKSRARGLKKRVEDLIAGDPDCDKDLQDIYENARCLTSDGWTSRLKDNQPQGPSEKFILSVYNQVYARAQGRHGPYSLETETRPVSDEVLKNAAALQKALNQLQKPMLSLAARLRKKLNDQADTLESDTRKRLDAVQQSLERRARFHIGAWIDMLGTLETSAQAPESSGFIDWMAIERIDGRAIDIGLYRHWIDPMVPFAAALKPHAHGVAVTSATLRDGTENDEENWRVARERSGVSYLTDHPVQDKFTSPFHYASQTRIFVVTDLRKDDLDQVAAAYKSLFQASQGGALGLFTAIQRLKTIQDKIAPPLEESGLPLYAQHVDAMDNSTLVDIFREDRHACLLGTDAVRDGVDVPGDSLRLIVFDRVPWPRPTILHKARREAFGKKRYDDMITRLKLKQAYGRLIRKADDRGVFVMLDSMLPTRLCGAFPETVPIQRLALSEVIEETKNFLHK